MQLIAVGYLLISSILAYLEMWPACFMAGSAGLYILFLTFNVKKICNSILSYRISADLAKRSPRITLQKLAPTELQGVAEAFNEVQYKLETLALQIDERISNARSEVVAGDLNEEQSFLSELLTRWIVDCRAENGAWHVIDPSGNAAKHIFSKAEGERFPAEELRLVNSQLRFSVEGKRAIIIDEDRSKSLTGGLSVFGYPISIVAALPFKGSTIAIWLGFKKERRPSERILKTLYAMLSRVRDHLSTSEELLALSASVAELKTQHQQKDDFIAHVSHDIRSPLNNIRASLSLLEDAPNADELAIRVAKRNCMVLGEIVDDLLDFSRHRVGHLIAEQKEFDLTTLVREVAEAFLVDAAQRGLKFECNLNVPCWVRADPKHMRRVVTNLLGNAFKYTEAGSVTVSLSRVGLNGVLQIRDTGVGIAPEHQAQLFAPFSRFHKSVEGVGLGLAVTKILSELNLARLSVQSEVGVGSVFSLEMAEVEGPRLSVQQLDQSRAESKMEKILNSPNMDLGPTPLERSVLLVDDDGDYLLSMSRVFERAGIKAVTARSVREATEIVGYFRPDAIISDCNMPGGGYQQLKNFLLEKELTVPFAVVSGDSKLNAAKASASVNSETWNEARFSKPVDPAVILNWIRECVTSGKKS